MQILTIFLYFYQYFASDLKIKISWGFTFASGTEQAISWV